MLDHHKNCYLDTVSIAELVNRVCGLEVKYPQIPRLALEHTKIRGGPYAVKALGLETRILYPELCDDALLLVLDRIYSRGKKVDFNMSAIKQSEVDEKSPELVDAAMKMKQDADAAMKWFIESGSVLPVQSRCTGGWKGIPVEWKMPEIKLMTLNLCNENDVSV